MLKNLSFVLGILAAGYISTKAYSVFISLASWAITFAFVAMLGFGAILLAVGDEEV